MLVSATGPVERSARRDVGTAQASPFYGHWTIEEPPAHFTARGRAYKAIDIAPCGQPRAGGRDFCGVSVADNGTCGATLFRFLGTHARSQDTLHGHGVWGTQRKNITLDTWEAGAEGGGNHLEVYLGDGYDFDSRNANMPKFHALYRNQGAARCVAR